jgi:hypothetical protein
MPQSRDQRPMTLWNHLGTMSQQSCYTSIASKLHAVLNGGGGVVIHQAIEDDVGELPCSLSILTRPKLSVESIPLHNSCWSINICLKIISFFIYSSDDAAKKWYSQNLQPWSTSVFALVLHMFIAIALFHITQIKPASLLCCFCQVFNHLSLKFGSSRLEYLFAAIFNLGFYFLNNFRRKDNE